MKPDPLALADYHWKAMIGAAIWDVLLIACANVAALMLARGMVRTRDYALRLALGADRSEIAREVVVEVAVLALVGCVAGALIASWAVGVDYARNADRAALAGIRTAAVECASVRDKRPGRTGLDRDRGWVSRMAGEPHRSADGPAEGKQREHHGAIRHAVSLARDGGARARHDARHGLELDE